MAHAAVSARDEILARIRRAYGAGAIGLDPGSGAWGAHGAPSDAAAAAASAASTYGAAALRDRLAERASEYRAGVRIVAAAAVAEAVGTVCAAHGARRLAVPDGLPSAWAPPGIELVAGAALAAAQLDALDGALTGCALAIAETGTLVLDAGPRCGPRALTLVPDLHVCVVEAAQIVPDLPAALALLAPHRPTTFVSGPSATSDIELARVEGVHGPRRLELVVVEDPGDLSL